MVGSRARSFNVSSQLVGSVASSQSRKGCLGFTRVTGGQQRLSCTIRTKAPLSSLWTTVELPNPLNREEKIYACVVLRKNLSPARNRVEYQARATNPLLRDISRSRWPPANDRDGLGTSRKPRSLLPSREFPRKGKERPIRQRPQSGLAGRDSD
jgi:hypothetical protein